MAELLLGQIPEAIYFALFMIFAKNLKEKRLLFTFLMIIEYIILTRIIMFNSWFQILYTGITFIILKVLYKEKAQITDIFTFGIASIILMIVSASYFFLIRPLVKNFYLSMIVNRLVLFAIVLGFNKHLYKIQNIYKKFWNRNDKVKKKIKSTTFRCVNLVIFNVMFYIINIGMLYCVFLGK